MRLLYHPAKGFPHQQDKTQISASRGEVPARRLSAGTKRRRNPIHLACSPRQIISEGHDVPIVFLSRKELWNL